MEVRAWNGMDKMKDLKGKEDTTADTREIMADIPRIMIAAPKSGSGKTIVTAALMQVCKKKGYTVQGFKCGPDYIDPMFHQKVLGISSVNLDTWFTDDCMTRELFSRHCRESHADLAIIEGVMGLYDGLGGIKEQGSSYDLARALHCPILLVIDAKGMGRSMEAVIQGFLSMDREHLIQGVLLNRTSVFFAKTMKEMIEADLPIKVTGCFPEDSRLHLGSRHLGLYRPGEIEDLEAVLALAAEDLEKGADTGMILRIAGMPDKCGKESCAKPGAGPGTEPGVEPYAGHGTAKDEKKEKGERKERKENPAKEKNAKAEGKAKVKAEGKAEQVYKKTACAEPFKAAVRDVPVRIAVARDEAFCFYYEDNLELLYQYGAEPVFFSPLEDEHLPEGIFGLYLGGGYPELAAEELSKNISMREEIRRAFFDKMPVVAECGGFMYLQKTLTDSEGRTFPMVGVLPGGSKYMGHLVRFGYIELKEHRSHFLPENESIKGHEFHYFDSDSNGNDCTAVKPVSGKMWHCVHETERTFIGYPHLYWPSCPAFAEHFVLVCRSYKEEKDEGRKTG